VQGQGPGQGKALSSPSTTPTDSNATKNVIHFGNISNTDHSDEMDVMENSKAVMQSVSRTIQSGAHAHDHDHETETETATETTAESCSSSDEKQDMAVVLQEAKSNPPSPTRTRTQTTQSVIRNTVDMVKKTHQTRKKLGVISIAGGINSQIGNFVGVGVGVAVMNTIGVGVFVGVTGTVLTVKSLKGVTGQGGGENRRMVTIGGEGSEKVVLVRPNECCSGPCLGRYYDPSAKIGAEG
jgi:hypothetical protein